MRFSRQSSCLLLGIVGVVAVIASCGQQSDGHSQASPDTAASDPSMQSSDSGLPTSTTDQPAGIGTDELWVAYGAALEAAEEAEGFASFADLANSADVAVVGTIDKVSAGRVVQVAAAPSSRIQFVDFHVSVTRSRKDVEGVTFELPIRVSSPELESAVKAAIQPQDLDGDGQFSDQELAQAYDAGAVSKAYDEYWESAVAYTVAEVAKILPNLETLFLLRSVEAFGTLRPINGDAIVTNHNGQASTPWRSGGETASQYPVAAQLASMTFEEAVSIALDVAK